MPTVPHPSDSTVKMRIVYLTAALSLVGFFLEVGPVGGTFQLVTTGLRLELPMLGFLAYLALAASAAYGLHLTEDEPTPKEDKQPPTPIKAGGDGGEIREYVRTRPELHQLRMFFIALGGYTVLKGITLALIWPQAAALNFVPLAAFEFGLAYVGIGWFILMQFLRWYAMRRRWVRLQNELLGVDVPQIIAVAIFLKPLFFFVTASMKGMLLAGPLYLMSDLLHLCVAAVAVILWFARPLTLQRTIINLSVVGGITVLFTIGLVVIEHMLTA